MRTCAHRVFVCGFLFLCLFGWLVRWRLTSLFACFFFSVASLFVWKGFNGPFLVFHSTYTSTLQGNVVLHCGYIHHLRLAVYSNIVTWG